MIHLLSGLWQHAAAGFSLSNLLWSLVTCTVSVIGLWLSGRNVKHGWRFGIASQAVWFIAGVATGRLGDIILCGIFVGMYLRNLRKWRDVSGRPEPKTELTSTLNCGCPTMEVFHTGRHALGCTLAREKQEVLV